MQGQALNSRTSGIIPVNRVDPSCSHPINNELTTFVFSRIILPTLGMQQTLNFRVTIIKRRKIWLPHLCFVLSMLKPLSRLNAKAPTLT